MPLLFFHAGLGALLLEGRVSLGFFWSLVACLAAVQAFGHVPPGLVDTRVSPAVLFPAQFLVAGVFWLFTTWLSHTLQALQAHVHERRQQTGRIDRLRAVGALAAGSLARVRDAAQHGDAEARAARPEARPRGRPRARGGERGARALRGGAAPDGRLAAPARRAAARGGGRRATWSSASARACARRSPTCRCASTASAARRWCWCPPVAFTQAVLNLVENALEESSPEAPVEVDVRATPERVTVLIRDHGPGWPEIVRDHLGEPFVTTRPGGVGLGPLLRLPAHRDDRRNARARRGRRRRRDRADGAAGRARSRRETCAR